MIFFALFVVAGVVLLCMWFRDLGFESGIKEANRTYQQGYDDGLEVARTLRVKLQDQVGPKKEWP